jgi:type IV pilus assembly protein PilW
MSAAMRRRPRQAARGFSIIEMLVAMTIAMVLTVVISQLFLTSKQTYGTQEEQARMQENGRFALELLARELRQAGFKQAESTGTFTSAAPAISVTNDVGTNSSDEFTVRFFGSDGPTAGTSDGTVTNCVGTGARRNTMSVDRFYISNNASGEPALFCEAGGNATELVSNVESMQVLLGEDTDGDKTADRYVRPGSGGLNMDNVVAVRLSLLLRTANDAASESDGKTYQHFGADYNASGLGDGGAEFKLPTASPDKRIRRHYQATVTLRNRTN